MKTILLLIPEGETRDMVFSQLSSAYALICRDQPPVDWDAEGRQAVAAVLVDLEHAKEQGAALSEQLNGHSPFTCVPILGLTRRLPREDDAACVSQGYFDIVTLPCPPGAAAQKDRQRHSGIGFHRL